MITRSCFEYSYSLKRRASFCINGKASPLSGLHNFQGTTLAEIQISGLPSQTRLLFQVFRIFLFSLIARRAVMS